MDRPSMLVICLGLTLSLACGDEAKAPLNVVVRDMNSPAVTPPGPPDMAQAEMEAPVGTTTLRFDPMDPSFLSLPYPSDAMRHEDGSIRLSDWRVLKPTGPAANWFEATQKLLKGWGLSSGIFLYFDGAIDEKSLPTFAKPNSAIVLIDVDKSSPSRGQRIPLECTFQLGRGTEVRQENEVSCLMPPGYTRRPNTTYAVALTPQLRAYTGQLAISPVLTSLMDGEDVSGWRSKIEGASFKAAREEAVRAGLRREDVLGIWPFTTGDPTAQLQEIDAFYDTLPLPLLDQEEGIKVVRTTDDFYVLTASLILPLIQQGTPPYGMPGEGGLARDAAGSIAVQGEQRVRFMLSVPRHKPMPAQGFPLVHYFPEAGLGVWAMLDRGPSDLAGVQLQDMDGGPVALFASFGIAAFAMDYPFHGKRALKGKLPSGQFINFQNMEAGVTNVHVAAAEQALALRWLASASIALGDVKSEEPLSGIEVGAGGVIRFDPARLVALGHSEGAAVATLYATLSPELDALILTGIGGNIVDQALNSAALAPLLQILERSLNYSITDYIDRSDPVLHSLQYLWDLIDPIVYAPKLASLDMLMHSGRGDEVYPEGSRVGLAAALELDVIGPIVAQTEVDLLRRTRPETMTLPYPFVPAARLGALVQYEPSLINAHDLIYQRMDARMQALCLALSVKEGSSPKLLSGDEITQALCMP